MTSSNLADKVGIKLFADGSSFPHGADFMEVFHGWIQKKLLPELMIDVADYAHVVRGTHVYFCGHESDYIIDTAEGRPGLLYRRKRAQASADPFVDSLSRALFVAEHLEKEPKLKGLTFSRKEVWIGVYDRLNAPNTEATLSALESLTRGPLEARLGGPIRFERGPTDAQELASVRAFV